MTVMSHFAASYGNFRQYPLNHPSAAKYGSSALSKHRERLHECKNRLFVPDGSKTDKTDSPFILPVRDISSSGNVDKLNIFNDNELENFLRCGNPQGTDGVSSFSGPVAFKEDEKCRFM